MSLWERITHAVGKDMDEKVAASGGVSAQRYGALVPEEELHVQASVTNARSAKLELRLAGAARALSADVSDPVGLGKDLVGQQLSIIATVDAAVDPAALVVLRVEVFTSGPEAGASERNGAETYSVEARIEAGKSATLELQLYVG